MDSHIKSKLSSFFETYPKLEFKKGEILIRADESPKGVFFIKSGVLRQYTINSLGEENTLNLFNEYTFIPMTWALADIDNQFFFEAVIPVVAHKAPKEDVLAFLEKEHDVLLDLTARAFRGLDGMLKRVEHLMAKSASTKVSYALYNIALRFGDKSAKEIKLPLPMTHNDMATIAGVTRETFSRELKKLENDKVVASKDRSIIILDIKKLEEYL